MPSKTLKHLLVCFFALFAMLTAASAKYVAYPVNMPVGSFGNAINNIGQIAGRSANFVAFITEPQGLGGAEIGTLGGARSEALAINISGQVVGWSWLAGTNQNHAFITSVNGTSMRDLGTLGHSQSTAYGINDFGLVTGTSGSVLSDGTARGFITEADGFGMTDIGSIIDSGYVFPRAIDISGRIVGSASALGGQPAFETEPNGSGIHDIVTLGGQSAGVEAIASGRKMAGWSFNSLGQQRAFLIDGVGAQPRDLGVLGGTYSIAYGVNKRGVVVGTSSTESGATVAFISNKEKNGIIDLNAIVTGLPEGVVLRSARAINDRGQIVANGSDRRVYIICKKPCR